jgi:hypothetical protein
MNTRRRALNALLYVALTIGCARAHVAHAQTADATRNVRITVIGCVQRSQPQVAGTTVVEAGETKYVLSNITLVPADRRTNTTGTGSTANVVAETVKMYRLDDSTDPLVAPHVGDRVQVTGSVLPAARASTGRSGRGESRALGGAPMLRVESLQKLASDSATCRDDRR